MKRLITNATLTAVILFGAILLDAETTRAETAASKPNFLVFLADDVGQEVLGCYGGTSYKTPCLDRLAEEGSRFMHCYSMPMCHPTRVTLVSGQYPARLGRPAWGSFPKKHNKHTFAHVLKKAGYATAVAGKWQLTLLKNNPAHPKQLGFDESCLFGWHEGPRYYQPLLWQNGKIRDDVADRYGPDVYCEFLIDFMERNKDRPFLAYFPMALCHDVTDDLKKPVPYAPGKDRYAMFKEMVEAMDVRVGRMVSALDRLGLREKTLILFLGDNGSPRGSIIEAKNGKYQRDPVVSKMGKRRVYGGKGGLTDTGTRVPLIANWKGTIPGGTTRLDLIDMSDFLPTLAELAAAEPSPGATLDGRSFAPQLLGSNDKHRDWVYCEAHGKSWVRNQRWKLYNDGRLIDVKSETHEKRPLSSESDSPESAAARKNLQEAMQTVMK